MSLVSKIMLNANEARKTIVVPDGDEPQMIRAAVRIVQEKIANVVLLGSQKDILKANKKRRALSGIRIIDPKNSEKLNLYAKMFFLYAPIQGHDL